MIFKICEQCHKKRFNVKIRTLHFPFLPKPADIIHSKGKICRSCSKKVDYMIRKTHSMLKPPLWFTVKFYIIKAVLHPKLLAKQIYGNIRTKN